MQAGGILRGRCPPKGGQNITLSIQKVFDCKGYKKGFWGSNGVAFESWLA